MTGCRSLCAAAGRAVPVRNPVHVTASMSRASVQGRHRCATSGPRRRAAAAAEPASHTAQDRAFDHIPRTECWPIDSVRPLSCQNSAVGAPRANRQRVSARTPANGVRPREWQCRRLPRLRLQLPPCHVPDAQDAVPRHQQGGWHAQGYHHQNPGQIDTCECDLGHCSDADLRFFFYFEFETQAIIEETSMGLTN